MNDFPPEASAADSASNPAVPEKNAPDGSVAVLCLSMLFVGICGICYEYTFSKLASDILGNSARQWAIIIGLMMFFMGVGADLQKRFSDTALIDRFIFLEVLLGILGGLGPFLILVSFSAIHDHFILVHYFFICGVGLLIGLEIPLLTRVNETRVSSLKRNLGLMLKMDYIGSFIGALIWIFILPRFFNVIQMSFFLGLVNLAVAAITLGWFRDELVWKGRIAGLIAVAAAGLGLGLYYGRDVTLFAEQKLYYDRVVFSKTTPYQHILITEQLNGQIQTYINGNLQFASADEFIYHEFLVHPAMAAASRRKKVLVLGGGDGLAVREVLKYPEVEEIVLVDIDPAMTELARTEPRLVGLNEGSLLNSKVTVVEPLGVSPGEEVPARLQGRGFFKRNESMEPTKVHILNLDAYRFLESATAKFDVIIVDFPDPNSLSLSKLYSLEFYQRLRDKLTYDGILIQQSTSPARAKEVFLSIGRTMKAAGLTAVPLHQYVPSFGDWGWWIGGRAERFSERNLLKAATSPEIQLPDNLRYLTRQTLAGAFHFGKNGLVAENTDINRILDDRIHRLYLQAWRSLE